MLSEDLTEAANVVRFPSGRAARPLMERVCDAEPDVREVLFAADRGGQRAPEDHDHNHPEKRMSRPQNVSTSFSILGVARNAGWLLPFRTACVLPCAAVGSASSFRPRSEPRARSWLQGRLARAFRGPLQGWQP